MNTPSIPKGALFAVLLLSIASVVAAQNTTTTGATASNPPMATGSISGMVVDADGQPVANVSIATISETQRKAEAVARYSKPVPKGPLTGYDAVLAKMTPADCQAAAKADAQINSAVTYSGGTPAGKTDAKGVFTIKNLPPDRYIVTATNADQIGSVQPLVVQMGAETKLPKPIKLFTMAAFD